MTYNECKEQFLKERKEEDGYKTMLKVQEIVNKIGADFLALNGGDLAELRAKIIGYKFYLSDYIADLERTSESQKIELKEIKAQNWERISEEIKAKDGRVKNKEQIENELFLKTKEKQFTQILYQTTYSQYKLKISAINDVITAVTQRIAELKRDLENAKY